jgi:hypothetical protein
MVPGGFFHGDFFSGDERKIVMKADSMQTASRTKLFNALKNLYVH